MKLRLTIIILLTTFISRGQNCDTIQGQIVNCADIHGLKQGDWEYWEYEWRQQDNYGTVPGFCQTPPLVKVRTTLKSKGKYIDNKKIDKWEYYFEQVDMAGINRTETYNPDGSVIEVKYSNLVTTVFNPDSSMVTSIVKAQDKDTINISCTDKFCIARFKDTVLKKFPFDNLDFEQYSFAFGVYARQIQTLKE